MKTITNKLKCLFIFTGILLLMNNAKAQIYITINEALPISCYGQNDGAIAASAGPMGNYTYILDGGSATNSIGYFNHLSPGMHSVCVTNSIDTVCQTINIFEPDSLDITFTTDNMVSCNGNDGAISLSITGGTIIQLSYLTWWTNAEGDTLNDVQMEPFANYLSGLSAGTYKVAIEDESGCFYDETYNIETASPISISPNFDSVICSGGTTLVNISGTGGISYPPNYASTLTYAINGSTFSSQTVYTLTAGTYTVVAKDDASCSSSKVINIISLPSTYSFSNATACDAYVWNGNIYTVSGSYTYSSTNAYGCDSMAILHITINAGSSNSSTVMACDAYVWNGNTYTVSGNYTYSATNTYGCDSIATLNLTVNHSSLSSIETTVCNSFTWSNGQTYSLAGTYTYVMSNGNAEGCDSTLTLHLVFNNGVSIAPKAFLFGAYDSTLGLMKDSLRAAVSLGDPYGVVPIVNLIPPHIPLNPTHFLPSNNAQIAPGVLSVSGQNAIVDWVFVEIRDGSNANIIVSKQHALIQRDGDVVSTDGVSPLYFPTLCPGNYYISIKHRNHLGVMTAATFNLSNTTQTVDFTTGNVWTKPGINISPMRQVQGVYTLWAGDVNNNKSVKYNGQANDKDPILNAVIGFVPPNYPFPPSNNTTYGYRNEDVNMDGKVRYLNTNNDRVFILDIVKFASPTSSSNEVIFQHTPN